MIVRITASAYGKITCIYPPFCVTDNFIALEMTSFLADSFLICHDYHCVKHHGSHRELQKKKKKNSRGRKRSFFSGFCLKVYLYNTPLFVYLKAAVVSTSGHGLACMLIFKA